MMRKSIVVIVLAACELQPAPKNEPLPSKPTSPPATPQPAKPAEPPTPPTPVETSAACKEVGAKIAQVLIEGVTDPAQKGVYERERANITRKTAEACTSQGWSEQARTCYLGAKTSAEIKACETQHAPPQVKAPIAPTEG